MKNQILLGSFLALTGMASAQWSGTCPEWIMGCNVGIGNNVPAYSLDLHTPNAGGDGIRIRQTSINPGLRGGATLRLDNATTNGHHYSLNSTGTDDTPGGGGHFGLHDHTANATRIWISSAGNVGIGTTSPPAADMLTVNGNAVPAADNAYTCGKNGARWSAIWAANGTIQTSDLRYKKNVNELQYGIREIMKLRPVSYNWKQGDSRVHLGLIAQELKEVIGEVVYGGDAEEPNLGVAYSDLIPVLIRAIQEQQKEIEALKTGGTQVTTGIGQAGNIEGFALGQNIPNPFSRETLINYTLPAQVKTASLVVYDLTGKQIATFPLEKTAASITITSENLSAGMYIYSVLADGKILDSKRMVVADK